MMRRPKPFFLFPHFIGILAAFLGCIWGTQVGAGPQQTVAAAGQIDFTKQIQPIFEQHCYKCHGPDKNRGDLRLDKKSVALKGGSSGIAIKPGNSAESYLVRLISGLEKELVMPPEGERLSPGEISLIRSWIDQGADLPATTEDDLDGHFRHHYAFKPLSRPALPPARDKNWAAKPIDFFIQERLGQAGLAPSPEADRVTLIRRLYGTLIGLPPSPGEVEAFVESQDPQAYEKLVEKLLASPRYGERWARHWLDVVRFAESHGFETNLERKNAWPYRDYVIRSFNQDKPYNQFVLEQLAGDAWGVEEATGYLVGGPWDAVKSPDINLTTQQRMDELHDMVSTTGSTFLGLTVGCARCHNHKFDPVSQVDYYAMQAVFAGVQHGERPLRNAETEERKKEAERLQLALQKLEEQLAEFVPTADPAYRPGVTEPPLHPGLNVDKFEAVEARFIRFNIFETAGGGEPCLDEIEVISSVDGENVAAASQGTKVSASGTLPGYSIHKLEHLIDGKYGNDHSWISDTPGKGWVLLELPATQSVQMVLWGRDRSGKLKDRLPNLYSIEAGITLATMKRVAGKNPLRPPVNARQNIERFAPIATKFLRFTIEETTGMEPCLDELEVYTAAVGKNIALAATGAKATASGTYPESEIHRLEHLNDGKYGNSRSWISNQKGKGWVQLEFPTETIINKVVWGRDRDQQYSDRLATQYRIETSLDGTNWVKVAGSNDREIFAPNAKGKPVYSVAGLNEEETKRYHSLVEQQTKMQKEMRAAGQVPVVYAGRFEKPPATHRLHRGEGLQKREVVAPASIEFIGTRFQLKEDAEEQARRLELGKWIVDPSNPLTARVMVNRLWHYHFGSGIVDTPSDFGLNGAKPSHPELLDWLAAEFIESGWSIKHMQRQLVLSSTYRQQSRMTEAGAQKDASSRLLWRFPPRRLEAEALRDSILAVSGNVDLSIGGPGFDLFEPNDNYVKVYNPKKELGPKEWRRMVYQSKPRMQLDDVFGAFDCPDAGQITPKRSVSTTPLQALNLLNSQFIIQQSEILARRLQQGAPDGRKQVEMAFQLAFNRRPTSAESEAAHALIEEAGLASFCRALFNANEFAYLF